MGLFDEQIARKPNKYPWTDDFIKAAWDNFWTPDEFDFKSDYHDYLVTLNNQEKEIIEKSLSAISQIEVSVKKFWSKLSDNFPHPSICDLGFVLANQETVHNRAYEKLLTVLSLEDRFSFHIKEEIFQKRSDYLRLHLEKVFKDDKKQYLYSLILFTFFVENISLFSQFYIILYFNKFKVVLKDTAQQVNYTRFEESCHFQVGVKLINTLRQEYPELFDVELEKNLIRKARTAFEVEVKLIDWILKDFDEECLNRNVLIEYIKTRFNQSYESIGYKSIFLIDDNLVSKFKWMDEQVVGNNKTDFFHAKSTNYRTVEIPDPNDLF